MIKIARTTIALIGIGVLLIGTGLVIGDSGVLGNLVIMAVIINTFPYFLNRYLRYLWIKSAEEHFPNFIRDLADSVRSGMALPEAISVVSRSNYGKLTEEIVKMNNRLSWGTPFLRALEIMENRLRDSKIISEALKIIRESYESGGNIVSTLDSISNDILMLREAEAERLSMVKQQIMIMYGIFVIFLAISIIIINIMVPMMSFQPALGEESMGFIFKNPCEGGIFFPCSLFAAINAVLGVPEGGIAPYYIALFFTTVMMEGLFIGLIAGQIGENSITAGFKHSLIMMFAAFGVFLFLIKLGMMAV